MEPLPGLVAFTQKPLRVLYLNFDTCSIMVGQLTSDGYLPPERH